MIALPKPSDRERTQWFFQRYIAHLHDDADAQAWLDGDGPRSVLEEKDRWQTK